MIIGLKARFSDLDEVLQLKPEFVELHFSDKDPSYKLCPSKKYPVPCFIHLPEIWHGYLIDLTGFKRENQVLSFERSIDIVQRNINKSERFFKHFSNNKNYFILHPGGMSFEREESKYKQVRFKNLLKAMTLLKTNKSEILLENLPPYPWYFGGQWNTNIFMDAEEIIKFCKLSKRKICFDTSHSKLYCNYAHKDFLQQTRMIKPYIKHLHVGDAVNTDGEGVQIDEGEINFREFFKIIKDYKGTVVNEVWQGYVNNFEGFKIANRRIKNYLKTI